MDVTLIVNGLDLSSKLSTYSVTEEVTYRKVITTLDDVEHPYPGAKRTTIIFSLFPLTDDEIQDAMKDNPSGQGGELTPLILIRPLD